MRVAYVCADLGVPVFGSKGCSIHVQEIVRSFLRRGDSVDLFCARDGGLLPADLARCSVRVFTPPTTKTTGERETAAQRVADQIEEALHQAGPFDLIYERQGLWSSAGPNYARSSQTPCLLEVNAPLIREQHEHRELIDMCAARSLSQQALSGASAVTAVSDEVAAVLMQDFEFDARKLHVVPNGVNLSRFSPQHPPNLKSDTFTIGFVGSLKPWHGVEFLLESFQIFQKACPAVRLIIVGDGPMRSALQAQHSAWQKHSGGCIHWTGSVDPSDVPGYLTSMDVAVAPYPDLPDFYFSPLKVYEYMACGVVPVASDIGQLKSIITSGVDGFLVKPAAVADLVETLQYLATHRQVCREVGERARQSAVARFSWEQVLANSLATIYPFASPPIPTARWLQRDGAQLQ
jgi:glycosyltransferase involved in cell wall biosynthesis